MERHRQLDAARRASRTLILCVFILSLCSVLSAQREGGVVPTSTVQDTPSNLQQLLAEKNWPLILETVQSLPTRSAETNYTYGIALANLNRWSEARAAFLAARKLDPRDARFPTELAGIAFKQNDRSEAKKWLFLTLRLSPRDAYANDFLGTIYFLDGNLEAALKYWNRAGKPALQNVHQPELRLDPVLLDRSLAFAPATVLTGQQLLASQARLRALGVLPRFSVRLDARPDARFDAVLDAQERNGFGKNKWTALLSTFRGLPFETVTPEYYNLRGSAVNIQSLYRWDQNKRRALAVISGPLRRDPRWRWRLSTDFRNENWSLTNFSSLPEPSLGNLNLRRESGSVEIASYHAATWNWSTGAEISHRNFRSIATNTSLPAFLFPDGTQLKHFARFNYDVLRLPERRFFVTASASTEEARLWTSGSSAFAKLQLSSIQHWFPLAVTDDYEMQSRVSYGRTYGSVPFDELFILGIERDNNLLLRGHPGTSDGKKGNAPLGRNYFLSNWEIDKTLYGNGLFRLTLGPFLDTGKITDPDPGLGSRKWLYDTGALLKLRAFGVAVSLTYGKDLRSGKNSFYVYLIR